MKYASCSAPSGAKIRSLQQVAQRLARHAAQDGAERVRVDGLVGEHFAVRALLRERADRYSKNDSGPW